MKALVLVLLLAATRSSAQAEDPKQKARELYDEATVQYNIGNYDGAIVKYQAAYGYAPLPGLLFNIAQAYRLKGDCPNALVYYKKHLAVEKEREARGKSLSFAEELERKCGVPQMGTAEQTQHRRLGPILLGAGGVALLLTGAILNISAAGDLDDFIARCQNHTAPVKDCNDEVAVNGNGEVQSIDARANASYVLMGLGGAALVGATVWWFKGNSEKNREHAISVAPSLAFEGLVVGGRF